MQDEQNENQDSTNTGVDITAETNTTEEVDVEKLMESNRKLFERTKKAEAEAKALRDASKSKTDISEKQGNTKPSDILKADEFKLYREGYNESEIDFIMHNGGRKILEDEKSPLTLGLRVSREQRKAEEASGQTSDKTGLSEVERKYTTEQMRNMKPDDLAKLIGYAS